MLLSRPCLLLLSNRCEASGCGLSSSGGGLETKGRAGCSPRSAESMHDSCLHTAMGQKQSNAQLHASKKLLRRSSGLCRPAVKERREHQQPRSGFWSSMFCTCYERFVDILSFFQSLVRPNRIQGFLSEDEKLFAI